VNDYNYIQRDVNRKLTLLAGLCARIPSKKAQKKAGKLIAEIEDSDLPKLVEFIKNAHQKKEEKI